MFIIMEMILVVFTWQYANTKSRKTDYKWFNTLEEFVQWYYDQGNKPVFSLPSQGFKSLTANGLVAKEQSPLPVMMNTDTTLNIVTDIVRIISDDGILFQSMIHSSKKMYDVMSLKYKIKEI